MLHQDMFQHGAGEPFGAVSRLPGGITPRSAYDEAVVKVTLLGKQEAGVACLVDVEFSCDPGPRAVVHPDPRDVVAVRDEFPGPAADDGRVGAVKADAREIVQQHRPHFGRAGENEGQAVLPQVAPAPSALAIIVIGHKGIAVDLAEHRLDPDPAHPLGEVARAAAECYFFRQLRPVPASLHKSLMRFVPAAVAVKNAVGLLHCPAGPDDKHIAAALFRGEENIGKPERANVFDPLPDRVFPARRRRGQAVFHDRLRPVQAARRPDEPMDFREKPAWQCAVPHTPQDEVTLVIVTVPFFVKDDLGLHDQAAWNDVGAVDQTRHVPVIPQVVRGPREDRDGRGRRDMQFLFRCIGQVDRHHFHRVIIGRDKIQYLAA